VSATTAPAAAPPTSDRTGAPVGTPARTARRSLRRLASVVVYVVVIVAVWSWYVRSADVPPYLLPPPGKVWSALQNMVETGQLWPNLFHTLRNIVVGLVLGGGIGMALGYVLWRFRLVRDLFAPYVVLLQAAPKIAFAPLFVLWFGIGPSTELVLVVLLAFFPMMVAMDLGLRSVSPDLGVLARLLDLSAWDFFRVVQIRAATPALMAGAKIAVIDAMTGAFLAEYITAQEGLGYLMVLGNTSYNTPLLVAAIVVTVLVGLAGFGAVWLVERQLLRWRE
jgi:NitT/TauT family transport system permease protein